MSTKNKIYVLGDSFCVASSLSFLPLETEYYFWVKEFHKEFKDTHELVLNSMPSRDVQTILDNWIKIIKHINKDDILIICVPFFFRIRVPLHSKDFIVDEYKDFKIINRFVTHHSWYIGDSQKLYIGDEIVEKKDLDNHIIFLEQLFFNNEGVEQNYNEVIESLYDLTKCNKYIFSWDDMKNKSDVIEYKADLDSKLSWSTLNDLYNDTNGEFGKLGDYHWDYRFQEKFVNYLLEKFKK